MTQRRFNIIFNLQLLHYLLIYLTHALSFPLIIYTLFVPIYSYPDGVPVTELPETPEDLFSDLLKKKIHFAVTRVDQQVDQMCTEFAKMYNPPASSASASASASAPASDSASVPDSASAPASASNSASAPASASNSAPASASASDSASAPHPMYTVDIAPDFKRSFQNLNFSGGVSFFAAKIVDCVVTAYSASSKHLPSATDSSPTITQRGALAFRYPSLYFIIIVSLAHSLTNSLSNYTTN